jgi:L-Ala-D/L-Glu epimerase
MLSLTAIELRLKNPVRTATGVLAVRRGFEVQFTHRGLTGRGEATPLEAFGTESLDACLAALEDVDFQRAPAGVADIATSTQALAATPAARFGFETALLDWLALSQGVPVCALLGLPAESIDVNALLEGEDAAGLALAAESAVKHGFSVLKLKVAARSLPIEAQRLYAVRQAVGPSVKIRLDANGGWTEAQARSALRGMEALEPELCEQPVPAHEVDAMRRVGHAVRCPIVADEALLIPDAIDKLLEGKPKPAPSALALKPMALGGLLPTLAIAQRAESVGVASYVTTLMDGPVARAAAAHLAAVVPGSLAHGLATVELFDRQPADAFTPVKGSIRLPKTPGWGL